MDPNKLDEVLGVLRKHKVSQAKLPDGTMIVFDPEQPLQAAAIEGSPGGWKDATPVDRPFEDVVEVP